MKRFLFILIVLVSSLNSAIGEHIVGGEFFFQCLGNNNFRITFFQYRDCNPGVLIPDNDDLEALFFVQDLDNLGANGLRIFQVLKQSAIEIPNNSLGPCVTNTEPVCINRATYSGIINLPNNNNGYSIINQRCCRNNGIISISNPSNVGSTFELYISGKASQDCRPSNASFNFSFDGFPPSQLCNQIEITTDQSASMSTADNIKYQFCSPYNGSSLDDPYPYEPYPYQNINYLSGYSSSKPLGINSDTKLDNNSGILTVKPSREGRFVVGVCAEAYKNSRLYASIKRDFQFNVFSCTGAIAITDKNEYISCDDYLVNFKSTSTGAQSFLWDFDLKNPGTSISNVGNPTYVYPDSGKYLVKLTINPGLPCSSSVVVPVSIYPLHTIDFELKNICLNDTANFKDKSISTYNDIISRTWSFGDNTSSTLIEPKKKFAQSGIYTVILTSETAKGCKGSVKKEIEVYKLPDLNFETKEYCVETNFIVNNTTTTSENINNYKWFINSNLISEITSPTLKIDSTGKYILKLVGENKNGCVSSLSKSLKILDPPKSAFEVTSLNLCAGQDVEFENLSEGIIKKYEWDFDNGKTSSDINPSTKFDSSGEYIISLKVDNIACAFDLFTKTIQVKPTPILNIGGDREICGRNTEIVSLDNTKGYILLWSTGETTDSINVTGDLGTLELTAELNGCFERTSINIINRCNVYVPNAFAPNGKNKLFNVINKNIIQFKLTIYNRWGEILFNTSDFKNGWDGSYKGQPCPLDNYGYSIELIDEANKSSTIKGFFMLIR